MKNVFTLFFVFFLHSAWATNYYFSAVYGEDSRTPVEAKNASTPWKTIGRLNAYFSHLQPGDSVLFKRGETFYGSIVVNKSGTAGSPIVIGAFGTGNRPVITGLTTLTNWVAVGKGIYESYNPSLDENVSIVLINDAQQPIGRYPNKGYLTIESHSGKKSITDHELSSAANWKGAELVIRSVRWKLDRFLIKSHSGKTLYYSGISKPRNHYGYFIQNSIKTLDQPGEWYYNSRNKKVSMFFGTRSPLSYNITSGSVNYLIYSSRKSYVVVDNLTLKGANRDVVYVNKGNNFTLKNCNVLFAGIDGVKVIKHAYFTLENCNVLNSYNNGITAGSSSPYAIIRNNIVKNSYYIAGMGQSGDGQGAGIRIGKNGLAEYNQVINSGYVGIQFGGDFSIVKNNYIDSFCSVKDDGAGIYTYNGRPNNIFKGRKVTGNIVLNGLGAPDGTNALNSSAHGIYMDDNTNGVEIVGNTVTKCYFGMYFHNSRQIVVKINTVYNNKIQLYMKYDGLGNVLRDHIVTNNVFFSKNTEQMVSSINTIKNDIDKTGRIDSNYYTRPIDDGIIIFNSFADKSGKKVKGRHTLDSWKSQYKYDFSSKRSSKLITPFKLNSLIGSNKLVCGSFNTSKDVKVWANNCTVSWGNSQVLDGGYLKVVPSAKSSSLVMGVGALSSAKRYILKYSLKGSSGMSINAWLRNPDYKVISATAYRTVSAARSENEIIFTPFTNQASGSLVFVADAQSTYYLDNIQLYEADAIVTNPDDSIRFVFNATSVNKSVGLEGGYVDVKNNKYSNNILLRPYASAVLIKDDGAAQNTTPVVSITSPAINATYKAWATISMSANATDADGSIKKVEFYNGNALLHTETTAPYTYSWKKVPAGNYTLTAKATDNIGEVTVSESVSISVSTSSSSLENDKVPEVNITSPEVNAVYNEGATVYISAIAADADGSIKKVEFYNGTKLLHTEIVAPYKFSWHQVRAGNYTITAKATDNNGNVTISKSVSISVSAPASSEKNGIAPKVNITSPETNAVYNEKATIIISADASDADGSIKKVEFYEGTTLLQKEINAPYKITWRKVPAGNYVIIAKATDNNGNVTTSQSITVSVTSKRVSHRSSSKNTDTSVVIHTDTSGVINNVHVVNLKQQQIISKTEPEIYNLKVFPNPAVNKIQINVVGLKISNQEANLSIQNLSGIMIKSIPVILSGKTIEADVTSLRAGMYIVSIACNNLKISKKFIKN